MNPSSLFPVDIVEKELSNKDSLKLISFYIQFEIQLIRKEKNKIGYATPVYFFKINNIAVGVSKSRKFIKAYYQNSYENKAAKFPEYQILCWSES